MTKFKDNYILVGLLTFAVALFLPVVFVHASAVTNSKAVQVRVIPHLEDTGVDPDVMAPNLYSQNKQNGRKQERTQEQKRFPNNEGKEARGVKKDQEVKEARRVKKAKLSKVNQINGAENRSVVARTVQNLLFAADKQAGPVGEQIRTIAQEQNSIKDSMSSTIDKIRNRGNLKTFLLGISYKNIGQLRSYVAKTANRLTKLNNLLSKTTDDTVKAIIRTQIADLQQEQQKVMNLIQANESKFSLFGWFGKLLTKQSS